MKVKVCGMRDVDNVQELAELKPDYIGFIFYPESKRYVGDTLSDEVNAMIPTYIQKVGVFVDEPFEKLITQFEESMLDLVQLHGKELPEYCARLKRLGIPVIKVFNVGTGFCFEQVKAYEAYCDFFLFDTRGEAPGGNGEKFDWSVLSGYKGSVPFFLSGGISGNDVEEIRKFEHQAFHGVDVNSGFEDEPGLKNIAHLQQFFRELQSDIY